MKNSVKVSEGQSVRVVEVSKIQSVKVSEQQAQYLWCMARNMYIDHSVCIVYQARSAGECNGCEHYKAASKHQSIRVSEHASYQTCKLASFLTLILGHYDSLTLLKGGEAA